MNVICLHVIHLRVIMLRVSAEFVILHEVLMFSVIFVLNYVLNDQIIVSQLFHNPGCGIAISNSLVLRHSIIRSSWKVSQNSSQNSTHTSYRIIFK